MNKPVYYKDLLTGHRKFSEEDLGRKGLSLSLLVQNQVPVPPFFIIKPDVFTSVISTIFQDTDISSLEDFRKKVAKVPLSPQTIQMLEGMYGKLSGFGQAWVAVRSSIVAPTHPDSRFSGIMSSLLNIRGVQDIEEAIKSSFSSLFEDRAYDYLQKKSISYGDVKAAVIVQKMIQAEVSGVMYTYDPITLNKDHVSIEAVFGLGDVLADGSLNPDVYTCDKNSLEIIEKKIVPQDWMKVRKVGESDSLEHLQKVPISKVWQYSQKLDDALIRELTQLADKVEKSLGAPHVIEWVMERGHLYILQAKKIETEKEKTKNDVKKKDYKVTSMTDIDTFTEIADEVKVEISKDEPKKETKKVAMPTETLLFTGTGASSGQAFGEVIVIPTSSTITPEAVQELKATISKKHIIITDEFTSQLEPLFLQAAGVVTNFGGMNSDAAITAREINLPTVVGTRIATSFLQNGFLVKIDGSSGGVYGVDFIPEGIDLQENEPTKFKAEDIRVLRNAKPSKNPKETKPKEEASKDESKAGVEKNELQKREELPVKVFVTNNPNGGASYVPSMKVANGTYSNSHSIMVPITSGKKVEISRIRRLKKETDASIYVLFRDVSSMDKLVKMKKLLYSSKVRRSSRVKFIAGISSIYGLLNTKDILEAGTDGILYIVPKLAKAYAPESKKLDDKFWQLFTDNIENIKAKKDTFVGMELPTDYFTIPLKADLKPLIKIGISSLLFSEQMDHTTADDISDVENEMMGIQLG